MLRKHRDQIADSFARAVRALITEPDIDCPPVLLEKPRQASHGDLACNVALQLARPLRCKPRDIADKLVALVLQNAAEGLIRSLEVAGPGFINIRIHDDIKRAVIPQVLSDDADFGRNDSGDRQPVLLEFVSANPTGPLHVGHGRQAALGDCLAALLEANGFAVHREFYYNDAGAQITNLALSVQARGRGVMPGGPGFPADGYRGDYVADIAADYLAGAKVESADGAVQAQADLDDLEAIREFAVCYLRHEQDLDLRAFGVRFDRYFLESSLYGDGLVEKAVDALIAAGHTYEADGALWLRTTDYGDDKDRVMRKSEGGYTYFVPDVAYHVAKWERGFHKVINIQGSDHHGTIARVRAGLQALNIGITPGYPDYVLHKMVTVMRGGQEVKISKRAGSYVTLRDLIDWSGSSEQAAHAEQNNAPEREQRGRDAVRFFLLSRKADSEFAFDIDLALSQSDENPVYYVQYAHARLSSVLAADAAEAATGGGTPDPLAREQQIRAADLSPLTAEREFALMTTMAAWPDVVRLAADELAPHSVAFYLKDLAAQVHSYYNAERFLVDDAALRAARLCLLLAARQVIKNGLALIGVSAPQRM